MWAPLASTPRVAVLEGDHPDPALLGGKGASLDRLVAGGFPVPPTAVVETSAYREFSQAPEIRRVLDRIAEGEVVSRIDVDRVFAAVQLTPAAAAEVRSVASSLGSDLLAVRSSATVEDLDESSFAGQYRSLLNVGLEPDDDLERAVKLVWASLWHPAPCGYRRAFGIPDSAAEMAVVLMAMVPADRAGVVFTEDPGGGVGAARIEAVDGLGEALVSGEETPAAWVVARRAAERPNGLPDHVSQALDLALQIEDVEGVAQDVEWAETADGVFIVQARPITVSSDHDQLDTPPDDHELTTAAIAEIMPGVLPPLRWETNSFAMEEAFRSVLGDLAVLGPDHGTSAPFLRRVRGRAALDFEQLIEAADSLPGAAAELEYEYFGGAPPEPVARTRSDWLARSIRDVRAVAARRRLLEETTIVATASDLLLDVRPVLDSLTAGEILGYRARLLDLAVRSLTAELAVAALAAADYQRLEKTIEGHLDHEAAVRFSQRTTTLQRMPTPSPAASAAVFAGPTWEEVGRQPPVFPAATDPKGQVAELGDTLQASRGWRTKRIITGQVIDIRLHIVKRLIRDVSRALTLRERTKAAFLEVGGEVRRCELELGRRLVGRGVLARADDVELLTGRELLASFDAGGAEQPPATAILARRQRWIDRHEAAGPLPVRFRGTPEADPIPFPAGERLEGWAAAGGRHEGIARVLRTPDDNIEPGEVLVAETTDASWSPLFVRAGAIVVERGGPLSHAAIVARELGVPAVLNAVGATRRLDGELVTVDGDAGVVIVRQQTDAILTPVPPRPPVADPFEGADGDGLNVFVPAIMSVGLLFSVITLLQDLVRWGGSRALDRRAAMAAVSLVAATLPSRPNLETSDRGLLPRPSYLITATVLLGGAMYVAIGSLANYLRDVGYVRDIAWLLAVALALSGLVGFLGGLALATYVRWPSPPTWAEAALRHTPLTAPPPAGKEQRGPSWDLTAATLLAPVGFLVTMLLVWTGRGVATTIDGPVADWLVAQDSLSRLRFLDIVGRTTVAVALGAVVGLAGFRCRLLAATYIGAFVVGLTTVGLFDLLVDRDRPSPGPKSGVSDAFPSGHLVQAIIIAGFFPLAVRVFTSDKRLAYLTQVAMAIAVVASAIERVHAQLHWPLDMVGSAFLGLTIVLGAYWVLAHEGWHRRCRSCPLGRS